MMTPIFPNQKFITRPYHFLVENWQELIVVAAILCAGWLLVSSVEGWRDVLRGLVYASVVFTLVICAPLIYEGWDALLKWGARLAKRFRS